MKSIQKCLLSLTLLVLTLLLPSCSQAADPVPVTGTLSSQAIFSAWSLGAGRSEVLSWLAPSNPWVEGWVKGKMLFAAQPLDQLPGTSLRWADTLVIRDIDLKDSRLELVFQNDHQNPDRLAKLNLSFTAGDEDFQALKSLAAARLKLWPNVLKNQIWLSPDRRYQVFCGKSGHLWRFLALRTDF